MYNVHYLNPISSKGTDLWTQDYQTAKSVDDAQAIMVRSAAMHDMSFSDNLMAVARAGAGVNNIPLDRCAQQGIVVFNTPGANANGVVELALCGMLLGSRDIVDGINWVKTIQDDPDVAKKVEKGKSKFAGHELVHKTLGVIGLGAIGGPLANAARRLGMHVLGCDPYLSIDAAWHLDRHIERVKTRDEIYAQYSGIETTVLRNSESFPGSNRTGGDNRTNYARTTVTTQYPGRDLSIGAKDSVKQEVVR